MFVTLMTSVFIPRTKARRKTENSIYEFLRDKLKLPINRAKSGIHRPVNFQVLGFGFVPTYRKGERGRYQMIVGEKGWRTLKQTLKQITRKNIQKAQLCGLAALSREIRPLEDSLTIRKLTATFR
jgi:hypothetical protein